MPANPTSEESLCLLRLSALGDVTHVLPLLHTLRGAWPEVAVTWVIGKGERRLLVEMPDALSQWIDAVRAGTGASRQELILALLEDRVARLAAPPRP